MHTLSDIVAYSPDHRLVLTVEVKGSKETSPEKAAQVRRNLMVHGLISDAPFFLLAFPTGLFLWKNNAELEALPDFIAPAKPVLREYLGSMVGPNESVRQESLEIAVLSWLADLASAVRKPLSSSEADLMVVSSGLYDEIKGGEVRSAVTS